MTTTVVAPPRLRSAGEGASPPANADFLRVLVMQVRALDGPGARGPLTDTAVLDRFILDRERRRRLPIIGEPEPATLLRIEAFYAAVALAIERRSGVMPSLLTKISNEGFGRIVLLAGRLVLVSRQVRDAHRFGFESVERLAAAGEALVTEGLEALARFPEAARSD